MGLLAESPRRGIKPKPAHLVKRLLAALFALLAAGLMTMTVFAADKSRDKELPEIDARTYEVRVSKRSQSNRLYLFENVPGERTKVGSIVLLKKGEERIMALRVLKTFSERKLFIARRVKNYGTHILLEPGDSYDAIEKIADLREPKKPTPAPSEVPVTPESLADLPPEAFGEPPPSAQDALDMKELDPLPTVPLPPAPAPDPLPSPSTSADIPPPPPSGPDAGPLEEASTAPQGPPPEILPYDPELDAGSSPGGLDSLDRERPKTHQISDDDDTVDDSLFGQSVDEVYPMDIFNHWLSGEIGIFRNNAASGGSSYFGGAGFRYAVTLGRMLFLRRLRAQDSLALEGGAFYYKVLSYSNPNDAYTVVPLVGTLRYSMLVSESVGVFLYGGIVKNLITSAASPTDDSLEKLGTLLPAAGGGLLFRIGPSWEARVDLGIDMMGGGLIIRF